MDNRFQQGGPVENGGMFTRERIQQLTQKIMSNYDTNRDDKLDPADMAKIMIDSYRGMNKHFIPTGYDLSTYAKYQQSLQRVYDRVRKGYVTRQDIEATALRIFLANPSNK